MKILVMINGTGFAVKAAIEKLLEENATLRAWKAAGATYRETRVESVQKRSSYQRKHGFRGSWVHIPMIHSVAEIDPANPNRVRYELGTLTFDVTLPKGYYWRTTLDGELYASRLCGNRDMYHVTGDELSDLSGKEIAAKLRKRYSPVILARRISRAIAAEATITLADSVAAGNCAAGTMQFAETLGVRDHVVPLARIVDRPSHIRCIAAGEDMRLKNAVIKAIERQGF